MMFPQSYLWERGRKEGRKEGEGEEGETWERERGREGDRENGGRKGLGRKAAGGREKERETCQCTSKGDSHIPLAVSSSLPLLFSSSPLVTLTDVSPLFLNRPVNPFY